jgi:hypothetical protein
MRRASHSREAEALSLTTTFAVTGTATGRLIMGSRTRTASGRTWAGRPGRWRSCGTSSALCLREDFPQAVPEAQRPVADGQYRGAHAAAGTAVHITLGGMHRDIGVHLGLQRLGQHPPRAFPHDLIDQRRRDTLPVLVA